MREVFEQKSEFRLLKLSFIYESLQGFTIQGLFFFDESKVLDSEFVEEVFCYIKLGAVGKGKDGLFIGSERGEQLFKFQIFDLKFLAIEGFRPSKRVFSAKDLGMRSCNFLERRQNERLHSAFFTFGEEMCKSAFTFGK